VDREVYEAVRNEVRRQQVNLELIASENYVSQAVLEALGSVLTNKYAEGYPGRRYYGGCEWVDQAETLAIERAKELFRAEHANVQPHSGSQANMAVYLSALEPGDRILGMSLSAGGHLTHGSPKNASGHYYQVDSYGVNPETGWIDLDEARAKAEAFKPKLLVVGASAYPRAIDYEAFAEIARSVGAMLMVDVAHVAGLIVAGLHPDPVPCSDFVTATTHKTMRGPRGGIILCRGDYAKRMDLAVFPGTQGGPLMHVIAAKAVALKEALSPGFRRYQKQIIANAKALCDALKARGYTMVTGGTDNHMMLVDLRPQGLTGRAATDALEKAGLTVNRNLVPSDPRPPSETSGVRVGTPALTSRGMREDEMEIIAKLFDAVLKNPGDRRVRKHVREQTLDLCDGFPIYSGLLRRLYEQDRDAYDFATDSESDI